MQHEPFTVVGRVVKTHGLNGEVSVAPATETPLSVLTSIPCWFTPPIAGVRTSAIEGVRPGPKGPIVSFRGVDSVDTAATLARAQVLVRTEDLPEEWFDDTEEPPVEGYEVHDALRGLLGTVTETIITGANDVWVVDGPFGEVLIPVIEDVVDSIDDDASRIDVRLLPGLIDGEDT